jgi:hypothetical protein
MSQDVTDSRADSRVEWTPPERPDWVQRINEEGSCMDIGGVVPLDEDSLLNSAMRGTGLSDFGDDHWREPFSVFVKALEEEADLNLMGRLRARSEILQLLEARLQVEDWYSRHPEIDDEEITQPIIIIGQGRSGTTLLQNVLSAHPENGVLMHWEMVFPCPPPEAATYETDPRIKRAHELIDQWNRVTPTLSSMHELAGDIPFEDTLLLAMSFMGPNWLDSLGQVPSYDAYYFEQDIEPALRYVRRVLKLLQWRNPRKRWVLKDPLHIDRLEPLMRIYPDACFVWSHRDPVRALASMVSIVGTIQWGRSDNPLQGDSLEYLTDPNLAARRLNAVIDQLEAGVVPPRQMCHVQYRDLVADPIATVESIYAHFGIELSDEGRGAMASYMEENPRDNRPPHQFAAGSDEAVARAHKAFARYQQTFDIPSE